MDTGQNCQYSGGLCQLLYLWEVTGSSNNKETRYLSEFFRKLETSNQILIGILQIQWQKSHSASVYFCLAERLIYNIHTLDPWWFNGESPLKCEIIPSPINIRQESTNYGPQVTFGLPAVFISQVYWSKVQTISLHVVCGCFEALG